MHLDRTRILRCRTPDGMARQVLRALRPSQARIDDAKDCADRLIADLNRLSERFTIKRIVGHGSIHRGTALAGFRDIDYLLVLDRDDLATRAGHTPAPGHAIGRLRDGLTHCRAGVVGLNHLQIRDQKHSVGVCYPGRGFRIDLVPALAGRGRAPFQIPSRTRKQWIETRPRILARRVETLPRPVLDAIRLVKAWKRARGSRRGFDLPSYGVEILLAARVDLHDIGKPLAIVRQLFDEWSAHGKKRSMTLLGSVSKGPTTLVDPTSGENLMAANTPERRHKLINAARRARAELADIDGAIAGWRLEAAANAMERLFIGRL